MAPFKPTLVATDFSTVQLLRSQIEEYQRVAWFLMEWAEREQRVALQGLLLWRWPSPSR